MAEGDGKRLQRIRHCCLEIGEIVAVLDSSFEQFEANIIAQRPLAMDLLQIGEIAGKLSDECRKNFTSIPWKEIRATRNWIVHAYGDAIRVQLWDAVPHDIPVLRDAISAALNGCSN